MAKGMDWRRARPVRDTHSIADEERDIAILGGPSRPRRPRPSKADLRRQAADAVDEWKRRQRDGSAERDAGVTSGDCHDER